MCLIENDMHVRCTHAPIHAWRNWHLSDRVKRLNYMWIIILGRWDDRAIMTVLWNVVKFTIKYCACSNEKSGSKSKHTWESWGEERGEIKLQPIYTVPPVHMKNEKGREKPLKANQYGTFESKCMRNVKMSLDRKTGSWKYNLCTAYNMILLRRVMCHVYSRRVITPNSLHNGLLLSSSFFDKHPRHLRGNWGVCNRVGLL